MSDTKEAYEVRDDIRTYLAELQAEKKALNAEIKSLVRASAHILENIKLLKQERDELKHLLSR